MPVSRLYFLKTVSVLIFLLYTVAVKSQPITNTFLQLSSFNAGLQFWSPSEPTSLERIMSLAKDQNDFTPIDLTGYYQGKISINASSEDGVPFILPNDKINNADFLNSTRFFAQLGFTPFSKKKDKYLDNRELLFGLFYQPYVYHTADFLDRDTLLLDSIIGNYVYYTEWTPVLGLTGDYIFKTDPQKRLGAYFGFGAGVGVAVHSVILENYGSFIQTIHTDTLTNGISTVQYFKGISDTKNDVPAVTSLLLEMRFPFGATLRIAEGFSLVANVEGKISKQLYFNGLSFSSRFGIAGTLGIRYQIQ